MKIRTGPRFGRLIQEVMAGVVQRSSRSALTILGTALGVASLIAVLGATSSANGQISEDFLRNEARNVSVTPVRSLSGAAEAFPAGSDERVSAIDGVEGAGRWWQVGGVALSQLPAWMAAQDESTSHTVLAASPGGAHGSQRSRIR